MAIINLDRQATSNPVPHPLPDADSIAASQVNGFADYEFSVAGHVVADIALAGETERLPDGSIALTIEALTVEE